MADGNAMSDKILRTVANIIKRNQDLQEFTIIPTEDNSKNKSPVIHQHNALGLESWCVKHIYQYACGILLGKRRELRLKMLTYSMTEDLNHLLVGALLINPEVTTFWNMRRTLVERDIATVEEELHFSKIVLSHKSKSNEAFSYRRWLLKKVLDKMAANYLQVPINFLHNELQVVHMASERSQNNYHSWTHRIWCIENLAPDTAAINTIIYSELTYSQQWINSHVSEHSGYHYRQFLIRFVKEHKEIATIFDSYYNFVVKSLLNTINDGDYENLLTYLLGKPARPMLLEETYSFINFICILLYDLFVLIQQVDSLYPHHESLYYHRRFLIHHLIRIPYEYHSLTYQKTYRICENNLDLNNKNITESDTIVNVWDESGDNVWPKLFKMSPKTNYQLCKLVSDCEREFLSNNLSPYCAKYKKWLTHVIGFE